IDRRWNPDEVIADAVELALAHAVAVVARDDVHVVAARGELPRAVANPPLDGAALVRRHRQQLGSDVADPHDSCVATAPAAGCGAPVSSAATHEATRSAERPSENWH